MGFIYIRYDIYNKRIKLFSTGSLSKGSDENVRSLIGAGLIQVLLAIIVNPSTDNHLIEICLCVLRSMYERNFAPREIINTNLPTLIYLIGKYDKLIAAIMRAQKIVFLFFLFP